MKNLQLAFRLIGLLVAREKKNRNNKEFEYECLIRCGTTRETFVFIRSGVFSLIRHVFTSLFTFQSFFFVFHVPKSMGRH